MFPAPPGALVATRILPSTTTNEVDTAWAGLTSALAGLLCASLNTLDKTQAVEPKYSFQVGTIIMIRYSDTNCRRVYFGSGPPQGCGGPKTDQNHFFKKKSLEITWNVQKSNKKNLVFFRCGGPKTGQLPKYTPLNPGLIQFWLGSGPKGQRLA